MTALRLFAMVYAAVLTVLWRRFRGRSRCARWTVLQEITIDVLRRNGRLLMRLGPERARRHLAALAAPSTREREVRREIVDIDGLPGEWIQPRAGADDGRVLLYFHGGGYVFGSAATYRDLTARLALATGARVLAADYRQAPESRFPNAVDDTLRAYRWLRASGVAADRIVVGGDSSGGALAVTTLLALRDAGEALPAGAVLISPWVDLEASSASVDANARLDWGDREYLRHWASTYLGDADPRDPLASPLHAELGGLPPLLVLIGSAELLRDEVTAFARIAEERGVPVDLRTFDDMVHGWVLVPNVFPQAQIALDGVGAFVRAVAGPADGEGPRPKLPRTR